MRRISVVRVFLIIILLVKIGCVSAQQRFFFQFDQKTPVEIFKLIEEQDSIVFFFKEEWLPPGRYTFSIRSNEIADFAKQLFTNLELTYLIKEDRFLVVLQTDSDPRQTTSGKNSADFIAFGSELTADTDSVFLQGKILDGQDATPLPGASVSMAGALDITNAAGDYAIKVPIGNYPIEVNYVGFEPYVYYVKIYQEATLDINLYESSIYLDEVVISDFETPQTRQTLSGVEKINLKTISRLPAVFGEIDPVRAILSLPGVTTVGEAGGGYNVRGGSAGQNQVLLDGITVFNPVHLFGFLSSFNPAIVSDITFYRGGIPAEYGGWVSSVLETNTVEADTSWQGEASVGLVSSYAGIRGPVGSQTGISISGRMAYPDYMIQSYPDAGLKTSSASFGEYYGKLTHRTKDEKNRFSTTFYKSEDRFNLSGDVGYDFENLGLGALWDHVYSSRLNGTFNVNYAQYASVTSAQEDAQDFELAANVQQWQAKYSLSQSVGKHELIYGLENTVYRVEPGVFTDRAANTRTVFNPEQALMLSAFIGDQFELGKSWQFNIGARIVSYFQMGDTEQIRYASNQPRKETSIIDTTALNGLTFEYLGIEPRISVNHLLGQNQSVKFSFQRTRQFIHRLTNTIAISPIDVWKLSDGNTRPVTSDRFVAGYYKDVIKSGLELSSEVYFSRFQDAIDFKTGSDIFLNGNLETELLQGKGMAYGLELMVKKNKGKISGWGSYTYSRSLMTIESPFSESSINDGRRYPSNFDSPHTVNAFMNWKLAEVFDMSISFTYRTGRPATYPESYYLLGENIVAAYDERNNYRIPDYHRMDLSFNWDVSRLRKEKRYRGFWNLTIYNLYGRDNAYSVFFTEVDFSNKPSPQQLSILPNPLVSVSYNMKLK